jgi:3-hydroxyacyl-CoA dehydrogenase
MAFQINKAVVIGSGTMGSAIAAHLANAGVPVTLLDIVPQGESVNDKAARNKIVNEGWIRCLKAKPANLMSSNLEPLVRLGNLDDDFGAVAEADWVIEAIVENLKTKQELMERIDLIRKEDGIVSTNTSGIPIRDISAGRSKGFIKHFLGTHFFNPPRYLKLLEIIPTIHTDEEVKNYISRFAEYRLGKGVVLCKDTPNFIGNRYAFGTGAFALDFILKNGYTVDEVDAITGQLMGRPKTATFRLIDLVGVDVWNNVSKNIKPLIPKDKLAQKYIQSGATAKLIETLIERNWLGNKTKIGFYKEVRKDNGSKEFWPLDLERFEHIPPTKQRFDSIDKVKETTELGEKLEILLGESDKAAYLVQALVYQGFQYAAALLPEVADSPKAIDDSIRWGFGHEAGPFEIWDMLGVKKTVKKMKATGYPAPPWVSAMLKAGIKAFYKYKNGIKIGVYDVAKGRYTPFTPPESSVILKDKKVVIQNSGATLYDMGDGIACVDLHTKLNTLDDDIFNIVNEAFDKTENDFDGLVISTQSENFSAGANLFPLVVAGQQAMWETLDLAVRKFQNLNMRMRYFPKPIVVAPKGLALGGGCEIVMHASRVVASSETYAGLVEIGAGVIPAGGGTKEMLRRLVNPPMHTENADVLSYLQRAFLQIGQANMATSAEDARQMAILGPLDRIVMNRNYLIAEAKREVLHMVAAEYHQPAPELIYAAGRGALDALRVGIWMFKEGKYISEYDHHVVSRLANAMCGGELTNSKWVSEQYILDLEREAFLSLCGEEKTQARMWSILQTGKPLHN